MSTKLNHRSMSDWAGEYFERGYAQRWGVLPVTDNIRRETSGLWRHLRLGSRARVLDLGCGQGRYALAFAERGAEVVGVDSADALLQQARRLGVELRLPAQWVRGDIRCLPVRPQSCDGVLLMDAFGSLKPTMKTNESWSRLRVFWRQVVAWR
jgi:ubiquinone/menaquinone biosynthesis C-methylase UbiE